MCGINGFNWNDPDLIEKMNEATRYRGPDGEGIYLDDRVSLGHRRLSIIDLSEKGRQPMSNEDGSIWLVFNGEIYNFKDIRKKLESRGHSFKSETDSEVIIHAYEEYGCDCVREFSGMWAFCIYDKQKNRLVLSRDRFGIKPLYYFHDGQRFIFSSMIAGILCHEIQTAPNDRAVMEYLAFNLENHDEYTFFSNIFSLKPGTILTYDLSSRQYAKQRWYNLQPKNDIDADAIREAFIEKVRALTVSDVSVGSCLSGGLDSSAIVSVLDRCLGYSFNTYSLISPGKPLDESRFIKEVGKSTKTRQFFTEFSEEDFLKNIDDFIVAQEEPVTGISPYAQYLVMRLAHTQGAKVLLDGQGGDEIFAGYDYYFGYYFYELFTSFKWDRLIGEMIYSAKNFKKTSPIQMFAFLLMPERLKYLYWERLVNRWIKHELLLTLNNGKTDPRWQAMDLKNSLILTLFDTSIPHLLRFEDKNSMRWSIESRVPFLEYEFVEMALSLSSAQKIKDGRTKVVFREAVENLVPALIRDRKDKIGFAAPSDDLMRNDKVAAYVKGIMDSDSFRKRPYWQWEKTMELFSDHLSGEKNCGDTLWKLVNTELWLRYYFD